MSWALANDFIVFTHDLDFTAILASTQARGPGVIQMRAQDILPSRMAQAVVAAIQQFEAILDEGAIVSVDLVQARARVLPLR